MILISIALENKFDIIVVGGGHAGCEAAAAAARMGSRVLLITMDLNKMAQMSCNPAIGGIGKGQIVREIDALGGFTGVVTDLSTIHFRLLNRSKGPAMWSPRAQCDKNLFSSIWRNQLEKIPNLYLFQDTVTDLIFKDNYSCISGVITKNGFNFKAKSVVLTNGTFLNGTIHIGEVNYSGGRIGEASSIGITEKLNQIGFKSGRMKTGTPVRVDSRSVDFSQMIPQKSEDSGKFSFDYFIQSKLPKRDCYILHTSSEVHDILKTGFDKSPLFTGRIKGIGPRYCPSIETKIETFADKDSHQLFLEPEGVSTNEMYLNGFSSSLPWDVQYNSLKKIKGLEEVVILRPGYAIEYDFFYPTQLNHTLESKKVTNLFFAGQINGTTGYEEAAGQGLLAGINAHLSITDKPQITLSRDQAYIGVMIDDLITKGVDEPYRVFTSRAEFRILIRQDNADERLTRLGYDLGLISKERYSALNSKKMILESAHTLLKTKSIDPDLINPFLTSCNSAPITQKRKLIDIILRPEISLNLLNEYINVFSFDNTQYYNHSDLIQDIEIRAKYESYLEKEKLIAEKISRLDHILIPANFNYFNLESLSTEARQKLSMHKPKSIGEAKRIPGISPSDINVLLVFFGR